MEIDCIHMLDQNYIVVTLVKFGNQATDWDKHIH